MSPRFVFFLILIFSFGNFRISDGLSPSLLQLNFSTPLYAEALPPIRIANDIPSLDWHKTLDLISARVILNLMVGLTEFNKEGKLVPALAQKWSISPDGKTYVFTLKEGLKWSDQTPLTAQHFVDGILRLLNPKTAAQGADFFWILVGAKEFNLGREHDFNKVGIRALDKKTIEFKLVRPTVSLPSLLSFTVSLPIRLDLVEAYGDKWLAPSKLAVLGPYKLAESKSQQIVLEVNDQYFGPPPRIKKFKFTTVNEGQTTLDLFYIV